MKRKVKNPDRVEVSSIVGSIFAYMLNGNKEEAKRHAKLLVEKLRKMGLLE
jgi:hypothetical protein